MASLNFYQCDYGIVISNASFTQQAENLASMNDVLLINGSELLLLNNDRVLRDLLDTFIMQAQNGEPITKASSEWLINDLMVRYGVSSSTIYKNFISAGLPYYKVGREYRFIPAEVEEWEIFTKSIPFGRNKRMVLQGYLDYKKNINLRLQKAKYDGNKKEIKEIKKEMRKYGIRQSHYKLILAIILIIILLYIFLGLGLNPPI